MSDRATAEIIAETRRSNVYYALIGFGAGAMVGATLALLYAPQSGRETREAIKDKWGDVSDRAGDVYSNAKDAVGSAYERTSSAINRAKDKFSKSDQDVEA